jgi:hypothetical protein
VPKRERYEQVSRLTALGDASERDLSELIEHLDECSDCRNDYKEFTEAVLQRLTLPRNMFSKNAQSDSEALSIRSRFLARAQEAGISFSPEALNPIAAHPAGSNRARHSKVLARWCVGSAIAASLTVGVGFGGYRIGRMQERLNLAKSENPAASNTQPAHETSSVAASTATQGQTSARIGASADSEQLRRIADLEHQLRESVSQLASDRAKIAALESSGVALRGQIDQQQEQLISAQTQQQAAEQEAAGLRTQLNNAQAQASSNEASMLLDEVKVKDLSDQLTQAQETLSADREVGSLMAERNLHIVDVYDTDAQGKTKPIFGRIFLTGNKRLLFYAYDLNASHFENTKYAYRVWGEKLGPGQSARALGAFYSDDAAQKRWVFECDDSKVLAEIDSVFVTVEPAAKESDHPRGPKLMFAYLRGDANHP